MTNNITKPDLSHLPTYDRAEAGLLLKEIQKKLDAFKYKTGVTMLLAPESTQPKDDKVDDTRKPRPQRVRK